MKVCWQLFCCPNNLTSDCIVEGVHLLSVRAVEALHEAPQKRVAPSLNALCNPCEGLGKLREQILSLVKDLVAGFWRISCRKERLINSQWPDFQPRNSICQFLERRICSTSVYSKYYTWESLGILTHSCSEEAHSDIMRDVKNAPGSAELRPMRHGISLGHLNCG